MIKRTVFVLICLFVQPLSSFAGEITVAAAANVQFPLEELKAEFTKETKIDVITVIGSSGKLTSQIENGAPFDVFLSADMKYPDTLYKDGFSLRSPKVYVYGVLVLWTMKDLDLSQGIKVLSDPGVGKIALADPQLAPYGLQAKNALKFYDLYESLKTKLVFGESISQVNQYVSTSAADIGFTAKSVVLSENMKLHGKWVEVDVKSYKPIAQGVIVLKYAESGHSKDAHEFYDFLFSPKAKVIFEKYGYKLTQ